MHFPRAENINSLKRGTLSATQRATENSHPYRSPNISSHPQNVRTRKVVFHRDWLSLPCPCHELVHFRDQLGDVEGFRHHIILMPRMSARMPGTEGVDLSVYFRGLGGVEEGTHHSSSDSSIDLLHSCISRHRDDRYMP